MGYRVDVVAAGNAVVARAICMAMVHRRRQSTATRAGRAMVALMLVALPVVVYVTYRPAPVVEVRTARPTRVSSAVSSTSVSTWPAPRRDASPRQGAAVASRGAAVDRVAAESLRRDIVRHACDSVRQQIVTASPPTFPPLGSGRYDFHQLGDFTYEVSGDFDVPNDFGLDLQRPFTVRLRIDSRRRACATFIEVAGKRIYGTRDARRIF